MKHDILLFHFSVNGPSLEERRRSHSSHHNFSGNNEVIRTSASVDRLNMVGDRGSSRKSMPDSIPVKISGREGDITAFKKVGRRSTSSQNINND